MCLDGKLGYCDPTHADADYEERVSYLDVDVDESELEGMSEEERTQAQLDAYYEANTYTKPDFDLFVTCNDHTYDYDLQFLEYFFMTDAILDSYGYRIDEWERSVLPACNEPLLVGINGYWYTDWKLVNGIWEGTYW